MRWLVVDSLYCPEQFFCSHLDSMGHYLAEAGEGVTRCCLNAESGSVSCQVNDTSYVHPESLFIGLGARWAPEFGVAFFLDGYGRALDVRAEKRIAQVAAICSPMPWEVRKPDGSPAFDMVVSSIPWMVDAARAAGCRAEYQPLAFDLRARACMMGVKRDIDCLFIGSTGGNHVRRTQLLDELKDVVTVLPPVFGCEYFRTLARAKVVLNVHAEWAQGAANAMRLFEAAGMGCAVVSDGADELPRGGGKGWWYRGGLPEFGWRRPIAAALRDAHIAKESEELVLSSHTYEHRVPQIIEWARSL